MKIGPIALLHKTGAIVSAALLPFGVWGLGGLAFIDAGIFPIPTTMDGAVIGYVASDHRKFLLYCLMAAVASALGSLIPYYVGRAGGNVPAEAHQPGALRADAGPLRGPGVPGHHDSGDDASADAYQAVPIRGGRLPEKPLLFVTAIFSGKFIQFLVCALITVFYGPDIAHRCGEQSTSIPMLCWRSRWQLGRRLLSTCCASCSTGGVARSFRLKRQQRRTKRQMTTT